MSFPLKWKEIFFCLCEKAAELLFKLLKFFIVADALSGRFQKHTIGYKNLFFFVWHFVWMPWHHTENHLPSKSVEMQIYYLCNRDCCPLRKQFSFDNILRYILLLFLSECCFILLSQCPPVEVGFLPIKSCSVEHIRLCRVP